MLKKLAGLSAALSLSACATAFILPNQEPNVVRHYEPVDSSGYFAENPKLRLEYEPTTNLTTLPIKVINKSSKTVRVLWDESVFLNERGESERIIHQGVKLIDRDKPMAPSLIAPKSNISDAVVPSSRISWVGQSWHTDSICGSIDFADGSSSTLVFKEKDCVGKTFGLLLSYEVEGKKGNITAKFRYKDRQEVPVSEVKK